MKKQIQLLIIFLIPFSLFSQDNDTKDEMYMNAYLVIADSSHNYSELRKEMFYLSEKLNIEIDTSGRGFDINRQLICLPENDPDNLYAGGYIPRRFPSVSLSLEHLDYYTNGKWPEGGETIIIVVGIFSNKDDAEALLNKLKSKKAFILFVKMYMGCMH